MHQGKEGPSFPSAIGRVRFPFHIPLLEKKKVATGYNSDLEVFMEVAVNMERVVGKTAKRNETKLYTQLEIVVKDI